MSADIPPPGCDLDFAAFLEELVASLRAMIPDAHATRSARSATIVYGGKSVAITDAGSAIAVRPPGLSIGDRRDAFVARTVARTIAGVLDARFSAG